MDSMLDYLSPHAVVGLIVGFCTYFLVHILRTLATGNDDTNAQSPPQRPDSRKKEGKAKSAAKKSSWNSNRGSEKSKAAYSPPWIVTALKGHTGPVLDIDFSSSGKYLASCGEDRAVLLWDTKDLTQREHKSLRVNIEFDHPTFVRWSPDSKAFIIHKYNENAVEVYKIEKKKEGGWFGHATKAVTFPKVHESDVIAMGISSTGKYIMTCSNKTDLVVWDLRGQILGRIDTCLMYTTCAKISPCGKFIVASGFSPDAKVWEVCFAKNGEFQEIKRVFELTGHSSGVYDVAFDADSSHMATVSKDGTWRFYDTKIEYKRGEDAHFKMSGNYQQTANQALIALSPDAEVVVVATSNTLEFFSTATGELDTTIEEVFSGNVTAIVFDALGKYLLVSGDKQIKVFHNMTGYKRTIENCKEKLKQNQTSATKERLEKLIQDCETFLNSNEQ